MGDSVYLPRYQQEAVGERKHEGSMGGLLQSLLRKCGLMIPAGEWSVVHLLPHPREKTPRRGDPEVNRVILDCR